MERDCMIAHGNSEFLKERLFKMSDPYTIPICSSCGQIATTQTECKVCNTNDVKSVNFPYAAKILKQYLEAMGIRITVKTE